MTFPTTSILDDFNRADGAITGTSNWISPLFSHASLSITSNQLFNNSVFNENNVWNVSYTDSEAYITLTDMAYGTNRVAVGVRFAGSGSTPNGYFAFYLHDSTVVQLHRYDSGTPTQLGSDYSFTASAGDKLGISAIGTTIKAYIYSSGSWSEVLSATDSNYSSGLLWLYEKYNATNVILDDFGGGEVVAGGALNIFGNQDSTIFGNIIVR